MFSAVAAEFPPKFVLSENVPDIPRIDAPLRIFDACNYVVSPSVNTTATSLICLFPNQKLISVLNIIF